VLSVVMSGLAFIVERRLVKALRQGTVTDARPARAPADRGHGGLAAQAGPEPRFEHVGDQAGRQHAAGAAQHDRDPALDLG
jgi:hypothetical protein